MCSGYIALLVISVLTSIFRRRSVPTPILRGACTIKALAEEEEKEMTISELTEKEKMGGQYET